MQNLNTCQEKTYRNILISEGTSPADLSTGGHVPPPVPPLSAPMFSKVGYCPTFPSDSPFIVALILQ